MLLVRECVLGDPPPPPVSKFVILCMYIDVRQGPIDNYLWIKTRMILPYFLREVKDGYRDTPNVIAVVA